MSQAKSAALAKVSLISVAVGILTLVPLTSKGAKSCPWAESLNFPSFSPFQLTIYSNFLLRSEIWHLFWAMGPKSKYLQRLSDL